jgi:hypothetical protein
MKPRLHVLVAAVALSLAAMGSAVAEPIKIAAFGDSSVFGGGAES